MGRYEAFFPVAGAFKMMIRKFVTILEECCMELGQLMDPPKRRAAAVAVVTNPYLDEYEEEVAPRVAFDGDLGMVLVRRCTEALGINPEQVECCGSAALVGSQGELEHASGILTCNVCKPFSGGMSDEETDVTSTKKLGIPGTEIDVPLRRKDYADVRTSFDSMLVRIPDAPREDEIVVVLAMCLADRS